MIRKNLKNIKGMSLVEVIIYCGLLSIILSILYLFYAQIANQRILQVTETDIYTNGYKILLDFQKTVRKTSSVGIPSFRGMGNILSLDNGNITYHLDEQGRIIKTEGLETNILSDQKIVIEDLVFSNLGPSVSNPTIKISFTVKGVHLVGGWEREESFQTAVTKR